MPRDLARGFGGRLRKYQLRERANLTILPVIIFGFIASFTPDRFGFDSNPIGMKCWNALEFPTITTNQLIKSLKSGFCF